MSKWELILMIEKTGETEKTGFIFLNKDKHFPWISSYVNLSTVFHVLWNFKIGEYLLRVRMNIENINETIKMHQWALSELVLYFFTDPVHFFLEVIEIAILKYEIWHEYVFSSVHSRKFSCDIF